VNGARIGVLILAIVAAGLAALLARGLVSSKPEPAQPVAVQPTKEVLVASTSIDRGVKLNSSNLRWQTWPASTQLGPELITKDARPDAIDVMSGFITRSAFANGEPIVEARLVDLKNGGFMSALISPGMRAVAIPVSPETSAGGFILPNDHVDLILTRRVEESGNQGKETIRGDTILRNVRVLAVDQRFKEEGDQVAIAKTATLELSSAQAELVAAAQVQGTISLALRSIEADKEAADTGDDTAKTEGAVVRIVRYGTEKTVRVR